MKREERNAGPTRRPAAARESARRSAGTDRVRRAEPTKRNKQAAARPERRKSTAASRGQAAHPAARRKRRVRRPILNQGFWTKLLATAAIAAAVLLIFVIFFKVRDIQVEGNTYYSAEEIIAAAGVEPGDNLLTQNKAVTAAHIKAALPYVSEVRITRRLPDTLVIRISEFDVSYAIWAEDGTPWLMTAAGKLLEPTDAKTAATHLAVQGFTIQEPKVGAAFVIKTDGDALAATDQHTATTELLRLLETSDFAEKIRSVTIASSYDIRLQYEDRYEIVLGNMENLDYKLACVDVVLSKLESYQKGVIDVSGAMDNKVYFKESQEK